MNSECDLISTTKAFLGGFCESPLPSIIDSSPDVWYSWYMGLDALRVNGITERLHYLHHDKTLTSPADPLHQVRRSRIVLFTLVELVAFGATMTIVQTVGMCFRKPGYGHCYAENEPNSCHWFSCYHHVASTHSCIYSSSSPFYSRRACNLRWPNCFSICTSMPIRYALSNVSHIYRQWLQ